MTDRTVRVVLQAVVDQYRTAMRSAAKDTEALGKETEKTSQRTASSAQAIGNIGMKVAVVGGAMLGAFGVAANAAATFEQKMSGVKAVSHATTGEMKKLSDAALKAGADTVFSASDAAEAEAELAKAGIAVKDILGGALTGALSLAAAGQLELADAATISAQAMNIFKLEGKDVGHIADVLAAGANKSAADVKQLGDALRQGGLVAAQTGLNLEETTGALAAFADSALVGSDAGTSLKTMLQRLTPQSAEAADLMKSLGITAYDAGGSFVGLEKLAGNLQTGLTGLTDEQKSSTLATIFGSDAVRAAAILYDQGAKGIHDYVEAVDDQGAAARMAATQMDNLVGDVEAFKGSLETAFIQGGNGSTGALRSITQAATSAVNAYGSLPAPVQQTAVALVGVTGAALAVSGAVMIGIGQLAKFKVAMTTAGVSAQRTAMMVRGVGLAMKGLGVGAAVLGLTIVLEQLNTAGAKKSALPRITEGLVDLAQQGHLTGEALKVFGDDFENLGKKVDVAGRGYWTSFTTGQKSIKNAKQDLDDLDKALAALQANGNADVAAAIFTKIKTAAAEQGVDITKLNGVFDDYNDALANSSTQSKLAGGATGGLTAEIDKQAEAAKEDADALRKQADALTALFDPIFAVQDALSKQAEAQDAVNKARKEHGKHSAEYKQAQQDALRATVDLDGALSTLEAGLKDGSVSLQTVNSRLDGYVRAGLLSAAQARAFKRELALVAGQTDTLTGKLGALNQLHPRPTVKLQNVDTALSNLRHLNHEMRLFDGTRANATARVTVLQNGDFKVVGGTLVAHAATGGYITGTGTGTSDSIPARLSNGEYVVNAEETAQHRQLLDLINSGRLTSMASLNAVLPSSRGTDGPSHVDSRKTVLNYNPTINNPVRETASQTQAMAQREAAFLAGVRG